MLSLMRKHAGSWIIKIVLGAIALAFALSFGVYSYFGEKPAVMMTVNGEPVSAQEVNDVEVRLREQARQQLGQQFDALAPALNFRQRATDQVVTRKLIFQAARQMGITVADSEVVAQIASIPAFQRGGVFDKNQYLRMLRANRIAPDEFEQSQRGEILIRKLSTLVAGSASVTPLEVDQAMTAELTKVAGVYKLFDPKDFEAKVTPDEERLAKFYKENQNLYAVPAKVVLTYLTFPVAAYRDEVKISDRDVAEAYEMERARYAQPEQVHARHILIKLPEDAAQAEVATAKELAEKILELAKKPGTDFAELAKKHSQGPTAKNGGDLGYFERGRMVGPFEEVAFSLKPGGIGLARTQFGFHVIKVEEHKEPRTTPLEEVAGEIKQELTERRAKDLAAAAAERAFDQAATGVKLEDMAKEAGRGLTTTAAFAPTAPLAELPGLSGLDTDLEGVAPGQIAPPLVYDGGAILARLDERIPATFKPLEEVKEEVRLAAKEEMSIAAARAAAQALLDQLAQAKDPAAELAGMEGAATSGLVEPGSGIEGLEGSQGLVAALAERPASAPALREPARVGGRFAAAVLKERQPPSEADLEAKRAAFRQRLLAQKQRETLSRFVQDLREAAEIKTEAGV